jgi:hypothetical protein
VNLYLCSQDQNQDWDTYDSFIGAFDNEEEARNHHPDDYREWGDIYGTWCKSPDDVKVVFIGEAVPHMTRGIILASFNAG